MAAARRVVEADRYVRSGEWRKWQWDLLWGLDVHGKTLGVLGFGRIGRAVARRALGFGMRVLYHDQRAHEQAERELGAERVAFDRLLADSDFISAHADLNDTTRGMFNAAAFARMKPTAVFVNTARGPLVVEADLAAALLKGTIFAAGLDVTDPEPPLAGNPLVGLRNCIVAPHIASATVSSRNAMAEIAADNLIAGLKGEPLRAWVNPEVATNRRKGADVGD